MKFLIEKDSIKYYDWCFHLYNAIQYQNWLYPDNKIEILLSGADDVKISNLIPVGSLDFMFKVFSYNNIEIPKNLGIEYLTSKICNRKIGIKKGKDITAGFIKEIELKGVAEDYDYINDLDSEKSYIVSDVIDNINSEWRVFIFNNQIVGIYPYAENTYDLRCPSLRYIEFILSKCSNMPPAYTIDIAIADKEYLIEFNHFFSIGLYGFANYQILPQMFSSWWNYYIKEKK